MLDDRDRKLLELLQHDAGLSVVDLADRVAVMLNGEVVQPCEANIGPSRNGRHETATPRGALACLSRDTRSIDGARSSSITWASG